MSQTVSFEKAVSLPDGELVRVRLLQKDDARLLGEYLRGLSAESKGYFGPHSFDQPTVDAICDNLDPLQALRIVAVTTGPTPRIIGYMILRLGVGEHEQLRYQQYGIALDWETDSTFAPSVADDYQNKKLGSTILPYLVALARQVGQKRLVLMGGTQATNLRAIHFYEKAGFKKVGEFVHNNQNNYDMICTL